MKRILAAALSLALLVSLAACGGKDRFDAGKVEEGVCYQLTGIAPDAVAMRVDGIDVPMDMYFYNLCYAASYMESYMNMYGMDLDWSMELQEGETVLDVTKDSILENTKSFAVIEKLAQENNVILDEAALSELETERAETVESLGGEESYRAELAKLGLSEAARFVLRIYSSSLSSSAASARSERSNSSFAPQFGQMISPSSSMVSSKKISSSHSGQVVA